MAWNSNAPIEHRLRGSGYRPAREWMSLLRADMVQLRTWYSAGLVECVVSDLLAGSSCWYQIPQFGTVPNHDLPLLLDEAASAVHLLRSKSRQPMGSLFNGEDDDW